MHNKDLAGDYVSRSIVRRKALQVLFDEQSWADVVREAQEIIELCLKAILRHHGIDPPRIHDVSKILLDEIDRFPSALKTEAPRLAGISKNLRRDREIAFYGSEDLTPSEFYSRDDAVKAVADVDFVLKISRQFVLIKTRESQH